METQVGLKTTALTLQLLSVMSSHWLTVLKHKMPRQVLFKSAGLVW